MSYEFKNENYKMIQDIFDEVRVKHPEVTNDMLDGDGTIYYMNGNDGTDFDWNANERLCEFMIFYKECAPCHGLGFVKVNVNKYGTADVFVYIGDDLFQPVEKYWVDFNEDDAEWLKNELRFVESTFSMYDKPLYEFETYSFKEVCE